MTWAARYSRTEQPELTIWRDGVEVGREADFLALSRIISRDCECGLTINLAYLLSTALYHDADLRADIAARVPVRECIQTDACRNHAVDGERCWEHGGSDPL